MPKLIAILGAAFALIGAATPPTVFVPETLTVKEGGIVGVPICRNIVAPPKSQVYYETANDTAIAPADYSARSGFASIYKNARCYTVSVTTKQNSVYNPTKQFKFKIRVTENGVVGNAETIIRIQDDDPIPPPPPPAAVKPSLSTAPLVSGQTVQGSTLLSSTGVWVGAHNYFYAWYRNNVEQAGLKTNSYPLTAADVGAKVKSGVVACNDTGCTFSYSNEVGPITAPVVNPPPPPPTCVPPQILVNGVCTTPVTPPPPTGWVTVPADGYNGLLNPTAFARAARTCSSIYRTAETDRVGISFLGVTSGEVFQLISKADTGWSNASWGYTTTLNLFNQSGNIWTVYPLGQTYVQAVAAQSFRTVSQDCLEGVKQG